MDQITSLLNDLYANWQFISPDRFVNGALSLLVAMVAGFLTGPRGHSVVPAFWRLVDITFGALARRLDNINRAPADLLFRGLLICILMILFFGAGGLWLEETLSQVPQNRLIEIIIVSLCITAGAVIHHGMRLYQVLQGAKMSNGTYLTLARSCRFDLSNRDDSTLTRSAAEVIIRLFDRGCVVPLIWYALGGLPLLFIYSALAALSWKVGYDGVYESLGKMSLALEKVLGFVPMALSASLLAVTTLIVPKSKPGGVLRALSNPSGYPYEQGGMPLAGMAHALNITLGGPVTHLNGRSIKRAWAGPAAASAKLQAGHLKSILYMTFIAQLYLAAALLGASLWAQVYF